MRKTPILLADGRELVYYNEGDGSDHQEPDTRDLGQFGPSSQIRRDPLLDQWVIVAGHRQDRTHMPAAEDCPLCPSTESRKSEIPSSDYDVVVFENRFPSLSQKSAYPKTDNPLYASAPGWGRCEVICFTSSHSASFSSLSRSRVRMIIDVWTERTEQMSRIPDVQQVFCFENRGSEIGVTEPHPHGQIYGYPFVTSRTSSMLASAAEFQSRTGKNLFDAVVANEAENSIRTVVHSDHWIAFVPFAARWPYEIHLYPLRRVPDFQALTDIERDELAVVYLDLLGRFDRLFPKPAPYIAAWHQAPLTGDRSDFAFHLELFTSRRGPDKLKYLAGSESAMDVFVGDIIPEEAALRLREVGNPT